MVALEGKNKHVGKHNVLDSTHRFTYSRKPIFLIIPLIFVVNVYPQYGTAPWKKKDIKCELMAINYLRISTLHVLVYVRVFFYTAS